jgi:hypothetical protein
VDPERPRQPIIANRAEAWLGVSGRLLVFGGLVLLFGLRDAVGVGVTLAGVVVLIGYLRRVGQRLGIAPEYRRFLRRWLGNGAFYQSLRVIRFGPPE